MRRWGDLLLRTLLVAAVITLMRRRQLRSQPYRTKPPDQEETVGALLELVRDEQEEERADAQAYGQRAGVMLGFCGVIVGLLATQAREIMSRTPELSELERWIAVTSLAAGVVLIGAAALMSLFVLAPKRATRLTIGELEKFPSHERVNEPKVLAQGRAMRGLVAVIKSDRLANRVRRIWLTRAAITLVSALLFLIVHMGVFLVDATNGPECQRASASQTQIASIEPAAVVAVLAQSTTTTPQTSPQESPFPCPDLEQDRRP
jgi:cytochrome bd-type quinol oxidase subunit 2